MDSPGVSGPRRSEGGEFLDESQGVFDIEDEVIPQTGSLGLVEINGSQELLCGRPDELDPHLSPQPGSSLLEDIFGGKGFETASVKLFDTPPDLLIPSRCHFWIPVEAGNQPFGKSRSFLGRKEKSSSF